MCPGLGRCAEANGRTGRAETGSADEVLTRVADFTSREKMTLSSPAPGTLPARTCVISGGPEARFCPEVDGTKRSRTSRQPNSINAECFYPVRSIFLKNNGQHVPDHGRRGGRSFPGDGLRFPAVLVSRDQASVGRLGPGNPRMSRAVLGTRCWIRLASRASSLALRSVGEGDGLAVSVTGRIRTRPGPARSRVLPRPGVRPIISKPSPVR